MSQKLRLLHREDKSRRLIQKLIMQINHQQHLKIVIQKCKVKIDNKNHLNKPKFKISNQERRHK